MSNKYKINWFAFSPKHACEIVQAIGARSLDKIVFYDQAGNILFSYTKFLQFPHGLAEKEAKKDIRKAFQREGATSSRFVRT